MARAYDMTRRSRRMAETTERIVAVTERLLAERPIGEVTLQAIAEGAEVSVQTVLRHLGSRDGCIDAAGARVLDRIEAQRGRTPPGDVDAALAALLKHYEAEGPLVLNLLAQEAADPKVGESVRRGRAWHRAWVERCFGPRMPSRGRDTVDALVTATDIYVWKLLRLDLGRSQQDTLTVLRRLVDAVLHSGDDRGPTRPGDVGDLADPDSIPDAMTGRNP